MTRHLYLHIPFCQRRCSYCDFNTFANMEDRIDAYVNALVADLQAAHADPLDWRSQSTAVEALSGGDSGQTGLMRQHLRPTIFLGGGTPTMLSLRQMERVLNAASLHVPLENAEITVEANPGTVIDEGYLRGLIDIGINRISFGVQSLHDPTLRVLGRIHTSAEALETFRQARRAGFERINLDFIFGLPGQTIDQWSWTLQRLSELEPDHISLYSLILEEGTPLHRQVTTGSITIPDDDETGDMYDMAMEGLASAGLTQYEISNWARDDALSGLLPDQAAHHNVAYWLNADYLAFGAGAHGHLYPRRWHDILGVDAYIRARREGRPPIADVTDLTPDDLRAETMMMGLRLNVGVSFAHFRDRCGADMLDIYGNEIAAVVELGLLTQDASGVRLTDHGRRLGNQVFMRFVS